LNLQLLNSKTFKDVGVLWSKTTDCYVGAPKPKLNTGTPLAKVESSPGSATLPAVSDRIKLWQKNTMKTASHSSLDSGNTSGHEHLADFDEDSSTGDEQDVDASPPQSVSKFCLAVTAINRKQLSGHSFWNGLLLYTLFSVTVISKLSPSVHHPET